MINTRIQTAAFGRTDRMTLEQFLLRISFDTTCPEYINPMRWNAMITWAKKRGYIF